MKVDMSFDEWLEYRRWLVMNGEFIPEVSFNIKSDEEKQKDIHIHPEPGSIMNITNSTLYTNRSNVDGEMDMVEEKSWFTKTKERTVHKHYDIDYSQPCYMRPKQDNELVFNGLDCCVRDRDDVAWKCAKLYVSYTSRNSNNQMFFVRNERFSGSLFHQCRIPEFTKDNPPPVDTLVKCDGTIYRFCKFTPEGAVDVFGFGRSEANHTDFLTFGFDHCEFVDFHESQFEWME